MKEKEKERGEGRGATSIKSNTLSTEIQKSKSNIPRYIYPPLDSSENGAICADHLHHKANNSIRSFYGLFLSSMISHKITHQRYLEHNFQGHAPKGYCGSHNRFVSTSTRHLLQKE